jgi:hypothetical protein
MHTRQMVVLLIALGMLAAGCGNDDGADAGAGSSGPKASGTGYELELADGWTDRTNETQGSVIRFDLLLVRRGDSPSASINILRENVGKEAENDELNELFRGQVRAAGARDVTPTRRAELGDEEAFTYKYAQRGPDGEALRGRQVALVHDGHAYTITLSALKEYFGEANMQFSQMLSSWRWR